MANQRDSTFGNVNAFEKEIGITPGFLQRLGPPALVRCSLTMLPPRQEEPGAPNTAHS